MYLRTMVGIDVTMLNLKSFLFLDIDYTHQDILPDVDDGVQEHEHSGANHHLSILQLTQQAGSFFTLLL